MPLIKSISGIRGTIGGEPGDNLTPSDILKFALAYGLFIKKNFKKINIKIVIGRDARISGEMISDIVVGALSGLGIDVIDLGLAATPTVEMAVLSLKAQGGIIITASHNPQGWNALKLLDYQGEFLSARDGKKILELAEKNNYTAVKESDLGVYCLDPYFASEHIKRVLNLKLVHKDLIMQHNFKVVVDGINSVGGQIVPELLKELGVKDIIEMNCAPTGEFAHEPEPIAQNLKAICQKVKLLKADLGIVVDPDVDRLAFIDEKGEMFGEEYTLAAVADYVLGQFSQNQKQNSKYRLASISNLSSSRALKDITEKYQGKYRAAAVGEVNVVALMKKTKAIIGGEGNGGVIYPGLHYGRDALVGIALFLSYFAQKNIKMSALRKELPAYFMLKERIELKKKVNVNVLFNKIKGAYKKDKITDIDGIKIDWPDSWVHLRASNTEPILRLYGEGETEPLAAARIKEIKMKISAYIK
ncbi:MAG: phosphoglucosamine mutase [Patescibacteria group bacterium]